MNTKRMMMPMQYALAVAVAALVAGCGGGGGGGGDGGGGSGSGGGTPPPTGNTPPPPVASTQVVLAGKVTALQEPQAVTSDSAGNLYVVDGGPHSILKFAPDGTMTTLAGASAKPGYADGPGANARFRFFGSSDIVSDVQGNLFVSDECNGMIRKLAADGTVSTLAGSGSTFCNMPDPFGPIRPTMRPAGMSKSMPSTATRLP